MVKKGLIAIIAVCMFLSMTAVSHAGEANAATKLGNGVVNLLTGWMELPIQIHKTCKEEGPVKGLTYGFVNGIAQTVIRTGAGLFDMIMFPAPPFDKPLMEPIIKCKG